MNRGGQLSYDYPNGMQYFRVAVVGNGANPPVAPTGTTASLTSTPDFPIRANALTKVTAEAPTRSATGVYTITYGPDFLVPKVLNALCDVYGVAGMWGSVTSVNTATRVITFSTFSANGTATDLTSSMLCVISIEAMNTNT